MVFVREMTKALGFSSGLVRFGEKDSIGEGKSYRVLPAPAQFSDGRHYFNSFSPLDQLLYVNATIPEFDVYNNESVYFPIGAMKAKRAHELEKKMFSSRAKDMIVSDVERSGTRMHLATKSGNLRILLANNDYLPFDNGAMGFVDRKLSNSDEFLMTPIDYDIPAGNLKGLPSIRGKSLMDMIQEYNVTKLYGPKTLQVLAMMGYSTRKSPAVKVQSPPLKYSTFYDDNDLLLG